MKDDKKPIDVNGDKTPITETPVLEIKSDKWKDMSLSELYDQKEILDSRFNAAASCGNRAIMVQIQYGVQRIQALIAQKSETESMRLI